LIYSIILAVGLALNGGPAAKLDSIYIKPENITHVEVQGESLVLEFSPQYWNELRDKTAKHINNKVHFFIDDHLLSSPYISSPIYFGTEISLGEDGVKSIASKINIASSKRRTITEDDKLKFLKKWFEKHPNEQYSFSEIINIYHKNDTIESSKMAITLFNDSQNESLQNYVRKYHYMELTDCYHDIGKFNEAIAILRSSLSTETMVDLRWTITEYIAYIYKSQKHYTKAKKYYLKILTFLDSAEEYYRDNQFTEDENRELSERLSLARKEIRKELKQLKNKAMHKKI